MKKTDELKQDYEKITASQELKEKVKTIFAEDSKKQAKPNKFNFKKYTAVAAGIAVIFTASVNLSPDIAYAMSDVPVLNSLVKVLTFGRYEVVEENYQAKIVTPEIKGLLDKDLENKINEEFKENSKSLIAAFEKDITDLKEAFGDGFHMGVESGYIVKTDTDEILAIDAYIVNTVGSSSTTHSFYTIDKKTGELLTLKGLFKEGSDYESVLSEFIKSEMLRMYAEENALFFTDGKFEGVFEKIKPDQNFYINNDGNLVICFDKYEISAGAQGSPEFIIPKDLVKDILK